MNTHTQCFSSFYKEMWKRSRRKYFFLSFSWKIVTVYLTLTNVKSLSKNTFLFQPLLFTNFHKLIYIYVCYVRKMCKYHVTNVVYALICVLHRVSLSCLIYLCINLSHSAILTCSILFYLSSNNLQSVWSSQEHLCYFHFQNIMIADCFP